MKRFDGRGRGPKREGTERPRLEPRSAPRAQHDRRGYRESVEELVFGVEPVRELVGAAPGAVRTLIVRAGDEHKWSTEIERVRAAGGRVEFVPEARIDAIAGIDARHQGIAAQVRDYNYASFEQVVASGFDPIVLVDGVTDPRNLGALMRSAEGAGVGAIILARDRTASVTPATIKSSAGAWIHLKIARCGNVVRAIDELKKAGYWVVSLAPAGESSIYGLDVTRKLAIIVGGEGAGVRGIVLKNSDFRAAIPMRGKVASLNVSVAGAVALFEIARRRSTSA
jgi:23S rRNA (guanosine2251-2'-O)-methyltransferase